MKPKGQWSSAHVRLKRLYEARVPHGVTQKDFAKKHGIGSQSMVAQYLNGDRPLNFEAAVKFADALGVTLYDICPEMGDWIRDKLLPALGKPLRRAAVVLLAVTLSLFQLPDAKASLDQIRPFNIINTHCRVFHYIRRLLAKMCAFTHTCAALLDTALSIPA